MSSSLWRPRMFCDKIGWKINLELMDRNFLIRPSPMAQALPSRARGAGLRAWRSLSSGEVPVVAQSDVGLPESPAEMARRLGLSFTNLSLLSRAFTHRSYINENANALEDNERLEFLGDAVLDFIVGAWVYNHCPEIDRKSTRLNSSHLGISYAVFC